MKQARHTSTTRGFSRAATLVQSRVRSASEGRGFAEARLLTHWADIVGADIAAMAEPVRVGFGRGKQGATLTLLTTGSMAPMLEMQKERVRERVNACYGYAAIARIQITQTAPQGFSEGRAQFRGAPKPADPAPDPALAGSARSLASGVSSPDLKDALERLATNYMTRTKTRLT